MTNEDLKKIDEEFENYRKNNTYPQVTKDIIDKIINTKINQCNLDENKYLLELYEEYLEKLDNLNKDQLKRYLTVLKNADVKDNQSLEKEDSFLLNLYLQSERRHAIDNILKTNKLDEKSLLKIHGDLLKGTSSSHLNNYNYSTNNRKFVGFFENKERYIQYLPLDCKDIEEAMNLFFQYYNDSDDKLNLFFKPFLIHGIIAALQVFDDGNTRLARLLQNTKIYKSTNKLLDKNLESPSLYVTRAYFPQRYEYRELITKVATDPNSENINNWIKFNINRTEDTLFNNSSNVEKIKLLKR